MIMQTEGTSPLALLADDRPVRARIGLALPAADLGLDQLGSSSNLRLARTAFQLG